ncbi:MAG: hypothetical protein ACLTER_12655 [Ruminococcus sp.]
MNTGKILTTEAAAILNTSPQFVRVAMQQGKLPISYSNQDVRLYGLITFLENFWRNIAEKMLKKSWNRSEKESYVN